MMSVAPRTRRPRAACGCRPRIESLEGRTLLSGMDTIEAAQARSIYGVDGTGLTAAMIDTGIDYRNPALSDGKFGPGHKVIDGYDFADNLPDPSTAQAHGISTAGLVASSDPAHPGVAPGAGLAGLRVFANDGSGSFDDVARALQYVIDHHTQDHITVVNISISDGGNYSYDSFSHDNSIGQQLNGLIDRLKALDIPVVVATGNSNDGSPGVGFPAILPDTISVTGSDPGDHLVANAQRLGPEDGFGAATDLAAPSTDLVAPTSDNQFAPVSGTSFAAPLVTGSVILLQQIYEKRFGTLPKVDDLVAWLKGGAVTVHDPVFNFDIGRLDVLKSASLIPPAPGTPAAGTTQVFVNGVLQSSVPSSAADNPLADFGADAGRPISFNLVQLWQDGQSTTVNLPPGVPDGGTVASHFSKVEIYTTGTVKPVVPTAPKATASITALGTPSDTVRTSGLRAFRPATTSAGHVTPRPSSFAKHARHR